MQLTSSNSFFWILTPLHILPVFPPTFCMEFCPQPCLSSYNFWIPKTTDLKMWSMEDSSPFSIVSSGQVAFAQWSLSLLSFLLCLFGLLSHSTPKAQGSWGEGSILRYYQHYSAKAIIISSFPKLRFIIKHHNTLWKF